MLAYEEAVNTASRPWAPWYAIPVGDKPYTRARVAEILVETLESIGFEYPAPSEDNRAAFASVRAELGENSPC